MKQQSDTAMYVKPVQGHAGSSSIRMMMGSAVLACCVAFSANAGATCGHAPTGDSIAGPPAVALFPTRPSARHKNDNGSIVGLWMATFYSGGQVFDQGFDQWHSDGTEILIDNSPPQPPNGTGSACLGIYQQTDSQTYSLKHPFWIMDSTGKLVGSGLYLENVTVDATGNKYSGTFKFLTYDLNHHLT
jgi:hypothetical protein